MFPSANTLAFCLGGRWQGQRRSGSFWGVSGYRPSLELPLLGPLPSGGLCTASLSDGHPHPVPSTLWPCSLCAPKSLAAQAVYGSSSTFLGVEAPPPYQGLGAQGVSPGNTTSKSLPIPEASCPHTSTDRKQRPPVATPLIQPPPRLGRCWEGEPSCRFSQVPSPTIWLQGWERIPHWAKPSPVPLSTNFTPWTWCGDVRSEAQLGHP